MFYRLILLNRMRRQNTCFLNDRLLEQYEIGKLKTIVRIATLDLLLISVIKIVNKLPMEFVPCYHSSIIIIINKTFIIRLHDSRNNLAR